MVHRKKHKLSLAMNSGRIIKKIDKSLKFNEKAILPQLRPSSWL
jgi:hypothetical protein